MIVDDEFQLFSLPATCLPLDYGMGISAPLSFLERIATEKWPFDQFRRALEGFDADQLKAEARWQMLNASLNGIKRVVEGVR